MHDQHRFPEPDPRRPDNSHSDLTTPHASQEPFATRIFFSSDGLRAGWSLLLYVILVGVLIVLAQGLVARFQPSRSSSPPRVLTVRSALVNEYLDAAAVALATLVMATLEHRRFSEFGLPKGGLRLFSAGLAWGFALLSMFILILRAAGLLVFDGRTLSTQTALLFGLLWLVAFLGVGLFEETFFRGYLLFTVSRALTGLYRLLGVTSPASLAFWTSAVIISFGFGFVHISNAGESPIGIISAGAVGLVFCLSLWRTGSLWWAIGFHAAWDWAESYLYGVADSGNMAEGHLFATHPQGPAVWSGGLTGPEGSIWVLPVLLATSIIILLTLPKNPQLAAHTQSARPM